MNNLARDSWDLGALKDLSRDNLCTWTKKDRTGYDSYTYLRLYKCIYFKKDLWLELVKCMWRKHRTVYHYHLKYICNDIVKLFCVRNLRYAERVQEMHDLAKYLPPPSIKGDIYEEDNWEGRDKELSMNDIIIE